MAHNQSCSSCSLLRVAPLGGLAIAASLFGGLMTTGGCAVVGGMAAAYEETSTRTVPAEYVGLEGKSFAVIVGADRSLQSEHPGLVEGLTKRLTERLAEPSNLPRAGGFVPAEQVLKFQYDNPGWEARPRAELIDSLAKVDRLVYIDLLDFRLHEPGNPHVWDGIASGTVSVFASGSDSPVFQRSVSVPFPGKVGMNPNDLNRTAVASGLLVRFVDRASWLFYTHEEPYRPEY
jgi:hypothetical protein